MIHLIGWPEIMVGGILVVIYGAATWIEIRKRLARQKSNPAKSQPSLK